MSYSDLEKIDLDSAVNPFSQCFSGGSIPLSRSELYNYLVARVPVKLVSELESVRRREVSHRSFTEIKLN